MRRGIRYWLPPLLWMGIIFYFSSRPRVTITHTYIYDFVIFKLFHMIEYGILYFLLFRALFSASKTKLTVSQKHLIAILLAVTYAISDEIHQTFIPTREGRVRDVFIDTVGILLMYSYIRYNFSKIKNLLI